MTLNDLEWDSKILSLNKFALRVICPKKVNYLCKLEIITAENIIKNLSSRFVRKSNVIIICIFCRKIVNSGSKRKTHRSITGCAASSELTGWSLKVHHWKKTFMFLLFHWAFAVNDHYTFNKKVIQIITKLRQCHSFLERIFAWCFRENSLIWQ